VSIRNGTRGNADGPVWEPPFADFVRRCTLSCMARVKTHFLCRSCGGVQSRWMGKCPDCGAWDSLERYTERPAESDTKHSGIAELWIAPSEASGDVAGDAVQKPAAAQQTNIALPLPEIERSDVDRASTGIGELDRVLGGGLVPGSVILLGGDPGIGKSTLMLQAAGAMARQTHPVLYVTSEESAYQTRLRAERVFAESMIDSDGRATPQADDARPSKLGHGGDALSHLFVLADTNLARIIEQARKVRPRIMVIDSVQMIYKPDLEASPGSVTQLRRCCTELVYLAKVSGISIVLVGHMTKDGQLAGPKLLEHLVDVVLSFEGDRYHAHRVVRGVKNRFGTTLEVGLFEMTGRGLREVTNITDVRDAASEPRPGSIICPAVHGTRSLLVEVQALTATGFLGSAKRKTSGLDANRLAMLIAVLEKHGGLRLADQDVFVSAVGGLKVIEPAADLAICLAIIGAHYKRTLAAGTAAVGEVGLGGEIRPVHLLDQRVRECARLGYATLILPTGLTNEVARRSDSELIEAASIIDAMEHLM
jgi:DNA repair protein RadA/Sms